MKELTHLNGSGQARMVDVGEKAMTRREAQAEAVVRMQPETLEAISGGEIKKGDVFAAARIAGILAAKKTPDLIPLCHPVPIESVEIDIRAEKSDRVRIVAAARCDFKTGIEMEALTAAAVAALTIYDMCKAIDRGMTVERVRLLRKSGGRSGVYTAGEEEND